MLATQFAAGRERSVTLKRRWTARAFVLAAFIAWAVSSALVPPYVIPGPFVVCVRIIGFFTDVHLFSQVVASIFHVAAALVISFLLGSLLAFLAYYAPVTRLLIEGRVAAFLNSFSSIGWALLSIVWFGLNSATVIFVVTIVILPISIINIMAGLDNLSSELIEMGRSFSRARFQNFMAIVAPSLYPFVFATLRISFGVACKVDLTAELFGGNSGLGFIVNMARQSIDTAEIFAAVAIMIAFYFLVDRVVFARLQQSLSKHYAHD